MTPILCLLFWICPTAISRFIIAIVVDAIQGCSWWSRTHVRQECFKRIPAITNLNSSSAVIFVSIVPGIQASVSHGRPGSPFSRFTFAMAHGFSSFTGGFISQATTASGFTSTKFIAIDMLEVQAFALAKPINRPVFLPNRRLLYNQQPAKGLAFQVN